MNEFKLFIAGETARTRKAVADLKPLLAEAFGSEVTLRVIDVIASPRAALEDGILATPTLVKANPPMKRVFGDFSDMRRVLEILGIHQLSPGMPGPAHHEKNGNKMERNLS